MSVNVTSVDFHELEGIVSVVPYPVYCGQSYLSISVQNFNER